MTHVVTIADDACNKCSTTILSWDGTNPPYSVGVLVGRGNDAPLYHLGKTNATTLSWYALSGSLGLSLLIHSREIDLPANTTITIAVKSKAGNVAFVLSTGYDLSLN